MVMDRLKVFDDEQERLKSTSLFLTVGIILIVLTLLERKKFSKRHVFLFSLQLFIAEAVFYRIEMRIRSIMMICWPHMGNDMFQIWLCNVGLISKMFRRKSRTRQPVERTPLLNTRAS